MTASVRVLTPTVGAPNAAIRLSLAVMMVMGADTSPAIVAARRLPRTGQVATVAVTTGLRAMTGRARPPTIGVR